MIGWGYCLAVPGRGGRTLKRALGHPLLWLLVLAAITTTFAGLAGWAYADTGIHPFVGQMAGLGIATAAGAAHQGVRLARRWRVPVARVFNSPISWLVFDAALATWNIDSAGRGFGRGTAFGWASVGMWALMVAAACHQGVLVVRRVLRKRGWHNDLSVMGAIRAAQFRLGAAAVHALALVPVSYLAGRHADTGTLWEGVMFGVMIGLIIGAALNGPSIGRDLRGYWEGVAADRDRASAGTCGPVTFSTVASGTISAAGFTAGPATVHFANPGARPRVGGVGEESTAPYEVPDGVVPLVGLRSWMLHERAPILYSFNSTVWPHNRSLESECAKARTYGVEHEGPAVDCSCGIYAATDLTALSGYLSDGTVVGAIEAWGRVIPGEFGFRAQYARVKAIWVDGANLVRLSDVAELYGAQMVHSFSELVGLLGSLPAPKLSFGPTIEQVDQ